MRWLALVALLVAGCRPLPAPSLLGIARLRGESGNRSLQSCIVVFGWDEAQLRSFCGEPDEWTSWTGHPGGRCAIYRDDGRTFFRGTGAEVGAACLAPERQGRSVTMRVEEVIGLDGAVLGARP